MFKAYYIQPQGNWVEHQYLAEWGVSDLINYFTLSFNFTNNGGLFNNAFWSLPIEFQYYLVFPLIILALRFVGAIGPVLIAVGSYFIHKHNLVVPGHTQVFFLAYTFCFGIVLAYLYEKLTWRINKYLGSFLFLCSVITCALAENGIISFGNFPVISNPYGWTGITGLVCIALLLFTEGDLNKHDKMIKPIHYLGEISYSLYLLHNLVLSVILLVCIHINTIGIIEFPVIIFLIAMPITVILSKLSYEHIEKNGIKLSRTINSFTVKG